MTYFTDTQLLDFLTKMANTGQINGNTAYLRKLAVSKILSVLSEKERKRLDKHLDVNMIFKLFEQLENNSLSEDSKKAYKSRFNVALKEYLRWCENPNEFKPKVPSVLSGNKISSPSNSETKINQENVETNSQGTTPSPAKTCNFIVPLRPNEFTHLALPPQLSRVEADRINEYITACINSLVFEDTLSDMSN